MYKKHHENVPYKVLVFVLYEAVDCIVKDGNKVTIRNRPFSVLMNSTTTRLRRAFRVLSELGYIANFHPGYGYSTFVLFPPRLESKEPV